MVQTLSSIALEFVKRQYAAASVPVTAFINTDKMILVNKFGVRTEVVATMPNNCREAAIKAEITKLLRFVQKTLTNFHNSADLVVSAKQYAQKMYESSVAFLHEHRPFNRSSDVSFTHDTYMKLMQLTMIHDELAAPLYNIAMDSESRTGQTSFEYLMIDEAQDINECQASIILLTTHRTQVRICRQPLTIVPANTKLYLIGDPYQSIYILRGASQALERAIDALPGGTSSAALCTLSASHRFGSNIAAVDNTYVKHSLKFSQQARYARMYNETAVPVPYDAPPIYGASYFAGIIHNSTSSELRPPYTVLCMTNRGVLEAGFRLLEMSELTDGSTAASTTTNTDSTGSSPSTASIAATSQSSSSNSTRGGSTGSNSRRMRFHLVAKNRDRYLQDSNNSNNRLFGAAANRIPEKSDFEKMLDKITELRDVALGRSNGWKYQDTECNTLEQVEALSDDLDDPHLGDRCRIVRKLMMVTDARFTAIMAGLKAAQTDDMKSADVIVCTAHFAKGSEWDRVQLHSDLADPLEPVLSHEITLPDCTCGAKPDIRTRAQQQQQGTRPHFISGSSSIAAASTVTASTAVPLCVACRVRLEPFDTLPADHWRRFKLSILDAQAANLLHVALTRPKRELRLNSAMDRFLEWVKARDTAYAMHAEGDINVVTQDDNMVSDSGTAAVSSPAAASSAAAAMVTPDSQL
eukprot:13961-Heterococcus_DN1.PRE.1